MDIFGLEWKIVNETLLVCDGREVKGKTKIAAFDLDSTLIAVKSGNKFPQNRGDWKFWHSTVPSKLQELVAQQFKIVVFTNQGGIEKGKQNAEDLKNKFLDLCLVLGFPLQCFMATATDRHRKPNPTMFNLMCEQYNDQVDVDIENSIYVGDAAGRNKNWKKAAKKDFSCDDRKFAFNTGLKFLTPEEFFLSEKPTSNWSWSGIDPTNFLTHPPLVQPMMSAETELIVFVGFPATGKTTFYRKYFEPKQYVWINRDTLKTKQKCIKAAKQALLAGKSVVIDNTNPDLASRQEYLMLAKDLKIKARCFHFDIPLELATHLNMYRETINGTKRVPTIGFNLYKGKFVEPKPEEGFVSIQKIQWAPQFENEFQRKVFLQRT